MISNNICMENSETDLLLHWFSDISKKRGMYKEPILGVHTVKLFKQICDAFEQSTQVFILAIEVAEDFIRAKRSNKQKISDPLLAAVTISFLCHKSEGAPESLKMKHVIDLLFHFTQKCYNPSQVLAMEGDVIVTLKGNFPVTTPLDDMDIIIQKYMSETRLRANIRPLCLKIFEYVYMTRRKWFKELKEVYLQNRDCVIVFRHLIASKFYIPVSVLIAAVELTHYHYILDIDVILADVTKFTKIHEDHVRVLAAKLIEILKNIRL